MAVIRFKLRDRRLILFLYSFASHSLAGEPLCQEISAKIRRAYLDSQLATYNFPLNVHSMSTRTLTTVGSRSSSCQRIHIYQSTRRSSLDTDRKIAIQLTLCKGLLRIPDDSGRLKLVIFINVECIA